MAKFFKSAKWKRRLGAGLAIALSATLSFGILSACGKTPNQGDDTEEDPALPTDTQLIKNGNFEFYNEMTKEEQSKRRTFINSPQSWSTNSENPSSTSASGVINVEDWDYMSRSTYPLIREDDRTTTNDKGEEVEVKYGEGKLTDAAKQFALQHWDEASLYDRAEFYSFFNITSSSGFEKFDVNQYSVDFDDLRYLYEDAWGEAWNDETSTVEDNKIDLHYAEGEEQDGSSVLMIHNHHYTDSEKTSGTAKYYTSSTDVSLPAGTAAEVSVWVKTLNLTHYDKVPVAKRAGAYIAVTNNVGSTALDQMQINDIITTNNSANNAANNGWQKYTIYIRANTFASTTFRIVLGLGRGTSDDRYEAVDGIALFDDLECKLIDSDTFQTTAYGNTGADPAVDPAVPANHICDLDSKEDARKFYSTSRTTGEFETNTNYALDLRAKFDPITVPENAEGTNGTLKFDLTEEVSGNRTYTSEYYGYPDNTKESTVSGPRSVLKKYSLDDLKAVTAEVNGTLNAFVKEDFANYPFANENIIMLLSTNGAAYTATLEGLEAFKVGANSRKLVSFWVKTSSILPGRSGAGAILVDGENRVSIASFDSNDVPTVDVDKETTDIWDGWVQCFFFVENDSDVEKSFSLELTFGPTAIADSSAGDYGAGYAAFANFETYDLTRAQYNYAATGTYAQKTTLTGAAVDPSVFDSAAANGNKLEEGLASPASYTGVLSGSDRLIKDGTPNPTTKQLNEMGIYTGMLSSEFAKKYVGLDTAENPWMNTLNGAAGDYNGNADTWWKNLFGSDSTTANAAYQPLVLLNTKEGEGQQLSYGFFAQNASVSANSATKISVRLKVANGTTAYIYLMDVSGSASDGYNDPLKANIPVRTYWYDENGNVVSMDPEDEKFDKEGKILLRLQENGLYKNEQDKNDTKYYANLANFDKDDDGNYVDSNDTPVFFFHEDKYYAYREEQSDGSFKYSTEVNDFPEGTPTRFSYDPAATPETVVSVTGTPDNKDQWITVNFYLKAGNTAKDYRLELWAGQRDYAEGKADAVGFPNGGYVFFDRCTTTTVSNFDALLAETADDMLDYNNGEKYPYRDEDDAEKLNKEYGRYYAFTLYDSKDFERYDATLDEDGDGNPWRKYVQSDYDEQLVYLTCKDVEGKVLGTAFPTVSTFIDYSVSEQMPDKAPSLNDEADEDDSSSSTPSTTTGDTGNIWLYLASALLGVAILFAIGAVIFRKFWSKRKKTAKVKAPKQPRAPKASKPQEDTQPEQPSKPEPAAPDEDDPYNE